MFAQPFQSFWLIPLMLIMFLMARALRAQKRELGQLVELGLLRRLFPVDRWLAYNARSKIFNFLGFLFLLIALLGPRIGKKLQEIKSNGANVYILFDCSDSMLSEDFKPNRLEKSKRLLTGLVEGLVGNRVGIIAFAGEPYIFCPMTFDLDTVKQFLKSIQPGMIPQPGTAIGSAIRLALSRMDSARSGGAIVLLSDGEDHRTDPKGAAQEAKSAGARIYSIGVGSVEGEPIPIRDGAGQISGYKKDRKGETIVSRMDEQGLAQIALATGGSYFRASESEQEIDLLMDQIKSMDKDPQMRKENVYENRYQWFLGISLLMFCLGEFLPLLFKRLALIKRVGAASGAIIMILWMQPGSARADGSYASCMRKGNKLYAREDFAGALDNFEQASQSDPSQVKARFNVGAAHYRMGHWEEAAGEFEKSSLSKDSALALKALYNLGNAQAKNNKFDQAINAYRQCLAIDPNDEDAKFNLKLVLQMQKDPNQQKKSDDSNKKQDKQGKGSQGQAKLDEQNDKAKKDNAKRLLQNAGSGSNDKPIFQPKAKSGKKQYVEDW